MTSQMKMISGNPWASRPFWLKSALKWGFRFGYPAPIGQGFLQGGSLMERNYSIICQWVLTKPR